MAATASLAARATEAAVLASGRSTVLGTTLLDASDNLVLSPDVWRRPSPSDAGFATLDTISADCRVNFHRNPQARSCWMAIDRDNLPLTGNYTVVVDGNTVTYDATAAAPADKDTLLSEWADEINNDVTVGALVTATRVKLRDADGDYDAIRLEAAQSAAVPASGTPAGATYSTYALGACSAPAAAALHIQREVDSASLRVWTLKGFSVASTVQAGLNTAMADLIAGWVETFEIGALDEDGFDERLNFAARNAGWIQLYDLVTTDATFTIVGSGDGIYAVTNIAFGGIAPATAS